MAPLDGRNALDSLIWLVESGADEAVLEVPVDRFLPQRSAPPSGGDLTDTRRARQSERSGHAGGKLQHPERRPPSFDPAAHRVEEAMEIAARCNSLADLKSALELYEGSQLKKSATKTVFADGDPSSRVVFVGEAPGYEEDRVGLPFVGRAGKLLDQMLAAISLDRSKAYIVNVLPWRPPDNRNPEAVEVAKCLPFLKRHLELVGPRILVLLGAVAVRHLLGLNEGIMRVRGQWLEYRIGDTAVPVMPTLHPAYLLRAPAHKRLAWRDLQAIAARLNSWQGS